VGDERANDRDQRDYRPDDQEVVRPGGGGTGGFGFLLPNNFLPSHFRCDVNGVAHTGSYRLGNYNSRLVL
jgi:hypothetical protein